MSRLTSAWLREQHMREHVVPACTAMFAAHPTANAIVFAVAQYWADEANDAVHGQFVVSASRDPAWPSCCIESEEVFGSPYAGDFVGYDSGLNDNSTMITAFASCCVAESDQEAEVAAAYTPYAVIRRVPGAAGGEGSVGVSVEVIGQLHRPEWEDVWVGDPGDED